MKEFNIKLSLEELREIDTLIDMRINTLLSQYCDANVIEVERINQKMDRLFDLANKLRKEVDCNER